MQISRTRRNGVIISLVSMVDVLLIMLVFFMVTSTYLDLDMIPLAEGADQPATGPGPAASGAPVMIRVGANGVAFFRGQALPPAALSAAIESAYRRNPALEVLVLPSGQADVQALVTVLDAIAATGVQRMRIIRLQARP